jgi:hypothetical protein
MGLAKQNQGVRKATLFLKLLTGRIHFHALKLSFWTELLLCLNRPNHVKPESLLLSAINQTLRRQVSKQTGFCHSPVCLCTIIRIINYSPLLQPLFLVKRSLIMKKVALQSSKKEVLLLTSSVRTTGSY